MATITHDDGQQMQGFGLLRGPGTATSDSIPAALSDGEVVIPAEKVRNFGARAIMELIDKGGFGVKKPPVKGGRIHAADGGLVDAAAPSLGVVNRTGNSYSGGNVSGPISVNGQVPGGTFSTIGAGAPAVAPAIAAAPVAPSATSPAASPPPAAFNPALGVGRPNALGSLADTNAQIASIRASYAPPNLGVQSAAVKPAAPAPTLSVQRPAVPAVSATQTQPQFFVGGGVQQPPAEPALQPATPAPAPAQVPAPPSQPATPPAPYTNRIGGGPQQMVAYRDGGMVDGPGTGTSDSIPAMLSKGEVVMPADTVQALGEKRLLSAIDATHTPTGFGVRKNGRLALADGGYVEDPEKKVVEPVTQAWGGGPSAAFGVYPRPSSQFSTNANDAALQRGVTVAGTNAAGRTITEPAVPVTVAPVASPRLTNLTDPRSTQFQGGVNAVHPSAPLASSSTALPQQSAADAATLGYQSAGTVSQIAGVSDAERLAQANRDIAFQQDKQKWRNPADPAPGMVTIDGAGQAADARQRFFDEANLRTAAARGSWSPRRGFQGDDAAIQAALTPLQMRAQAAKDAQAEAAATNRALIGERGTEARARLVDARQQETNAVDRAKLVLEQQKIGIDAARANLTANKDTIQQLKDTQDIFSILDQAQPLLTQATNSTAGNAVDKLGQMFGVSTKGAEAGAQLKALQGALVAKMPKMSGPQSDKDVQLYREMAGQIGDPTIPHEQRAAAMQTIRSINEKYLPAPADATGFASLPSGATFRAPDGSIRRKP
jgi:hypothetical protein